MVRCELDSSGSGPMVCSCVRSNESLGFIKSGEFLD